MNSETKAHTIGNIFIRFSGRVYQMRNIMDAVDLIKLIKKEYAFEEYREKLWDIQWKNKQKRNKEKNKQKAKLRKLKVVPKKKVA